MACHCIKNRQGARRVTTFNCKHRQAARRVVSTAPSACGWLRGTSRTSPGPPRRWQRPVWLRSTSARGRGFAAYLSACGGQPFNVRCAHYARGASLSTFGFVTIVPRYLLPQVMPSHSFAARTRAYCAPHKRSWKPTNACQCQPPRAPRRGIGVRTRQRHLAARACCAPRKWRFGLIILYNGFANQPSLACTGRRATPKGVERALGSGTLPPRRLPRLLCAA